SAAHFRVGEHRKRRKVPFAARHHLNTRTPQFVDHARTLPHRRHAGISRTLSLPPQNGRNNANPLFYILFLSLKNSAARTSALRSLCAVRAASARLTTSAEKSSAARRSQGWQAASVSRLRSRRWT